LATPFIQATNYNSHGQCERVPQGSKGAFRRILDAAAYGKTSNPGPDVAAYENPGLG